jgi:hypothetical protein
MATAAGASTGAGADRDRYAEATSDLASHIGEKILTVLRHPDNQSRLQSILDPIVSHIIQRVFPYILLSAILFLILFILTIGTFWIVVRSGGLGGGGLTGVQKAGMVAGATVAKAIVDASMIA